MPTLAAPLDFTKLEGRNFRAHILGTAPASPVTGQLYFNSADNTLYWWDGTTWTSARGGASSTPPATTSALGTIQLAGDLAGTATSPQIAAGVIVDTDVNAANKDGLVAVPSLRTLGAGAQQAMPGNRTLDAVPLAAADVSFNSKKIIGLADPISPTDGATKQYVDGVAQGLDAKASVRAASNGNLTLSASQTVDGVAVIAGDRVLAKNQTTPSQNGIYIVAAGAWTRATDADAATELVSAFTFVEEGTTQKGTGWVQTAPSPITVGTTSLVWTQFSGAGEYIAGGGLTLTGTTFDVGAGAGITINPDTVQIANAGVTAAMMAPSSVGLSTSVVNGVLPVANGGTGQIGVKAARETGLGAAGYYSSATHSAGTTITIPQGTHTLRASTGLIVQCQIDATGAVVLPDIVVASTGDVTITFAASQGANTIRTTVIG